MPVVILPREPVRNDLTNAHGRHCRFQYGAMTGRAIPRRSRRPDRPRFGRPFWMDEAEYHSLIATRGLHGLVISMNTAALGTAAVRDLWLRVSICFFAGLSVLGIGLAWHTLGKSSELQMHLLRASELNSHLREMNVAAAVSLRARNSQSAEHHSRHGPNDFQTARRAARRKFAKNRAKLRTRWIV